jgi:hypothetical protein
MSNILEPIESRIRQRANLKAHLSELKVKSDEANHRITSHMSFDFESHSAKISDLTFIKSQISSDLSEIASSFKKHSAELMAYRAKAVSPLNVFNYFNAEQTAIRHHINKLEQHCKSLKNSSNTKQVQLKDIEIEYLSKLREIDEFKEFDVDSAKSSAAAMSAEVQGTSNELCRVEAEIADIEARCGSQISEYKLCVKSISDLQAKISKAETLDRDLSSAANGYDRAMIHQECGRLFGIDKPRRVISDTTSELRKIKYDLPKIEKRLTVALAKVSRTISHIIIDGNNACYRQSNFIRLAAITHIVDRLSEKYKVSVVFDASIRRLMQADDNMIKSIIGRSASTYITPTRTSADEYILEMAGIDESVYVISNDGYAEYRDYPAVKDGRIVRFMITDDKVIINDLDTVIALPGAN